MHWQKVKPFMYKPEMSKKLELYCDSDFTIHELITMTLAELEKEFNRRNESGWPVCPMCERGSFCSKHFK